MSGSQDSEDRGDSEDSADSEDGGDSEIGEDCEDGGDTEDGGDGEEGGDSGSPYHRALCILVQRIILINQVPGQTLVSIMHCLSSWR
ncbi:uncharacterized [Tachysurus ichikawai]